MVAWVGCVIGVRDGRMVQTPVQTSDLRPAQQDSARQLAALPWLVRNLVAAPTVSGERRSPGRVGLLSVCGVAFARRRRRLGRCRYLGYSGRVCPRRRSRSDAGTARKGAGTGAAPATGTNGSERAGCP
jgi:hypothetical protein